LRRTSKYGSDRLTASSAWQKSLFIHRDATLRVSGALHLGLFEQPAKIEFFSNLLDLKLAEKRKMDYNRIKKGE